MSPPFDPAAALEQLGEELQSAEVGATIAFAGADLEFTGRLDAGSTELACSAAWPPGETPLTLGALLDRLGASNPLDSAPGLENAGALLSSIGFGRLTLSLAPEEPVLGLVAEVDAGPPQTVAPGTRLLVEIRPVDGAGGGRDWSLLVALSLAPADLLQLLPGNLGDRLDTLLGTRGEGPRTIAWSTHVHPCSLGTLRRRLSGADHEGALPVAEGEAGDDGPTLYELARRHDLDPAIFLLHNAGRDLFRPGSLTVRLPAPRTVEVGTGETLATLLAGLGATLDGAHALSTAIFDRALLAGDREGDEENALEVADPAAADPDAVIDRIRITAPISLSDLLAHHGLGLGDLSFAAFDGLRLEPSTLKVLGRPIAVERGATLGELIARAASMVPELAGMTAELAYSVGVVLGRLTLRPRARFTLPGVRHLTAAELDQLVTAGEIPAWARDRATVAGDGLLALAGAAVGRGINVSFTLPADALTGWLPASFRLPAGSTLAVAIQLRSTEEWEVAATLGTDLEIPSTSLTLREVSLALAPDTVRLSGEAEIDGLPGQQGTADARVSVRTEASGDFAVTGALGEDRPLAIAAAGVTFALEDAVLTWQLAGTTERLTAHGQLAVGEDVRLGSSLEIVDAVDVAGGTDLRLTGTLHSDRPLGVGDLLGLLAARGAAAGDPGALPPQLRDGRLTGLVLELDTAVPKVEFEASASGTIPLGVDTDLVFGVRETPTARALGIRIEGDPAEVELVVAGGLRIGGAGLEGELRFTHREETTTLTFDPTVVRAERLGLTGPGVDQSVDLPDLAAAFTGQPPGTGATLHLSFGQVGIEASSGPETAWRAEANLTVRLTGVPGTIGDLINDHPIPMVLAASTDGVTIDAGLPESRYAEAATAAPLLEVDVPFTGLQGAERAIVVRLVAARFAIDPQGVSIAAVVVADLDALKPDPPRLAFPLFTDALAFSVGVDRKGASLAVLSSPFAFGPVIENGWLKLGEGLPPSLDFGDLDLQLPVLEVGQPPRVGGAARWSDLKLPLGPLKALLASSKDLAAAADALPASLPLEFPDLPAGDELSRLRDLVRRIGERAGVDDEPLQLVLGAIDELRELLDRFGLTLPTALAAYLRPPNLAGFTFDVAVRPSAGLGFELALDVDPAGDPIRILFPAGQTTLGGLTLRGISIGELFGGSIVTVSVDASLDLFVLPAIAVAAARLDGGPDRLESLRTTITLRDLYMWIVTASGVPIPLPLTYDELSFRHHGSFGEELELAIAFPTPSGLSLTGLLGTATEVIGALQSGDELRSNVFAGLLPTWSLDAARLRLPDFMGDVELGSSDAPVWEIGGGAGLVRILNPVAAAARAVRQQPFGLAGLLVETVPLERRSGHRQAGLEMACIRMGFDWAVATGDELGAGRPPALVARLRELPVAGGTPAEVLAPLLPFAIDGADSDRPFLTVVGSWEIGVADISVVLGLVPGREELGAGLRLLAAIGVGGTIELDASGRIAVASGAGSADPATLTVAGSASITAGVLPQLFAGQGTIELSVERLTMAGSVHLDLGDIFAIKAAALLTVAPGSEVAVATSAPARPSRLDLAAAAQAARDTALTALEGSAVAGYFSKIRGEYERRRQQLGVLAGAAARGIRREVDQVIATATSAGSLGRLRGAARDLERACRDYRQSRAWQVTPPRAKDLVRELQRAADRLAETATESNVKAMTQLATDAIREAHRQAAAGFERAKRFVTDPPQVESLSIELGRDQPLAVRMRIEGKNLAFDLSTDRDEFKDGVAAATRELLTIL